MAQSLDKKIIRSKKNKKFPIWKFFFILCIFVVFVVTPILFINSLPLFGNKEVVCRGVYQDETARARYTRYGSSSFTNAYFKLESGEIISLTKDPNISLRAGDRVWIYGHKGWIFKNNIYDRYSKI